MTPTPTPRTDERANSWESTDGQWVNAEFARQLERELAELRKNTSELIASLQTETDSVERELADAREWSSKLADVADELRADLATEREQLAANHEATKLLGKWLEQERELADRLAALIKRDRDGYGGQVVDPECNCCDCEYLRPIDESLAAWKEARNATV